MEVWLANGVMQYAVGAKVVGIGTTYQQTVVSLCRESNGQAANALLHFLLTYNADDRQVLTVRAGNCVDDRQPAYLLKHSSHYVTMCCHIAKLLLKSLIADQHVKSEFETSLQLCFTFGKLHKSTTREVCVHPVGCMRLKHFANSSP